VRRIEGYDWEMMSKSQILKQAPYLLKLGAERSVSSFAVGSLTLSIFLNSKVFEWSQELKLPSEIKLQLQHLSVATMLEQQRSPHRTR
jgi:hypothetical protein